MTTDATFIFNAQCLCALMMMLCIIVLAIPYDTVKAHRWKLAAAIVWAVVTAGSLSYIVAGLIIWHWSPLP